MARNTSVSLGEPYVEYIDQKVESGNYGSASEVIRDALRMKMQHDTRIEALRAAIIEGEESGPARPIDPEEFLKELKNRPVRKGPFDKRVTG